MEQMSVPPEPALMESMRSVGYTLSTSVADVIDNSIAAAARHVWIDFLSEGERFVAITDDGQGMDDEAIVSAMRLAATNPRWARAAQDLGRFGLGLKTASLAQCRTLTVVSKTPAGVFGVRWSLDHLATTGDWSLLKLDSHEAHALPGMARFKSLDRGTVVLWQDFGLLESTIGTSDGALDRAMMVVRDHLALVFHRFIAGDDMPQVVFRLNDNPVPFLDPFLTKHRATQQSHQESFLVAGERVLVKAFTLPFLAKMSKADRTAALVAGTLRDSQGFYVYRAGRLVIWGDWFRLEKRSDMSKLARVRVDIPNTLDHLWALDIKKSAAIPPPEVRRQLKRLSERMVKPSKRVQTFRGRPVIDATTRLWETIEDRETFRYTVNRSHPAISALKRRLEPDTNRALDLLLESLETTFPIFDAHNRLSQDQSQAADNESEVAALRQAADLLAVHRSLGGGFEDFIAQFSSIEPLNRIENIVQKLRDAGAAT